MKNYFYIKFNYHSTSTAADNTINESLMKLDLCKIVPNDRSGMSRDRSELIKFFEQF